MVYPVSTKATLRHSHAVCTLWYPPTSSFLLPENLSPKDIARSDVRSWKFHGANAEEVWQKAGPDVIWRLADAAWLHSFHVWTSHCPYLDHAYLHLHLYLRGTVHCLVNPKNWSLWWKLRGTTVKNPPGMTSIRLVYARDQFIHDLLTLSDLLWCKCVPVAL